MPNVLLDPCTEPLERTMWPEVSGNRQHCPSPLSHRGGDLQVVGNSKSPDGEQARSGAIFH